jgi:hypothetical protein
MGPHLIRKSARTSIRPLHLCLYLLTGLSLLPARAQTVVQNLDLTAPCCDMVDSVDIGPDGTYDVRVDWSTGLDHVQSMFNSISADLLLAYPVQLGEPYEYFYDHALLGQTAVGCFWAGWLPNTGLRYVGFKRVDTPTDTTFGWVELNFHGDPSSCQDTIEVIRLAYNTVPNIPLPAGDVMTGIEPFRHDHGVRLDAQENTLVIDNRGAGSCVLDIWTCLGQRVTSVRIGPSTVQRVHLGALAAGTYVAVLQDASGSLSERFVR